MGADTHAPVAISASTPVQSVCLQATDYFLWALQRLYARGEDRFVKLLWPRFSLVMDMDDTREADYGVYYNQRRPLTAESVAGSPGI